MNDELVLAAIELLQELGEPVVIRRLAIVERDPATGEAVGDAEPLEMSAPGYPDNYESKEVDGATIRASDIKLILGLTSQRPQVGWLAEVDSKTLWIMSVAPIRMSGQDIIYICQLRAS